MIRGRNSNVGAPRFGAPRFPVAGPHTLTSGGGPTYDEVWLIAGQSLAYTQGVSGSGGLPVGWVDTHRVKMWSNSISVFETYSPAAASTWGPEVEAALEWLADNAGNSRVLYLVKFAVGSTQLGQLSTYGQLGSANRSWSQPDADLFVVMTGYATAAKATLAQPKATVCFWVQGEADSGDYTSAPNACDDYDINATLHYQKIRELWGDAQTKIVAHQVSKYYAGYRRDVMSDRQRVVAALSSLNVIIDTGDFLSSHYSDQIHWTASGAVLAGGIAYKLAFKGGVAPSSLSAAMDVVSIYAQTGYVAATLSCINRDGKAAISWSLQTSSSNFELVGNQIKVKAGASLANGTTNLVVRATAASGLYAEITVPVVVGQWWTATAVSSLDFDNARFYHAGTEYPSLAAMVTAGVCTDNGANGLVLPTAGWLPAGGYSILLRAKSSSTIPAAAKYAFALDDGNDGSSLDELIGFYRSATPSLILTIRRASPAINVSLTGGSGNSDYEFKWAATVQVGTSGAHINGVSAGSGAVSSLPVITHMNIANNGIGDAPWSDGVVRKVEILSQLLTSTERQAASQI